MSGHHQADAVTRGRLEQTWVVGEQDARGIAWDASQRAAEVGTVTVVVHTRDVQGVATFPKLDMTVAQNIDPMTAQRALDDAGAHSEVVVTQHGKYARGGPQTTEDFRYRLDGSTRIRYEVAGERNQVRLQQIRKGDD